MDTATTSKGLTGGDVKAKAADAADQAGDALASAADQAKDKLQEATGQVKEQAAAKGAEAKGRVRSQVDDRSSEFGERAGGTATDLRSIGDHLREQGNDQPAQLADQIADQLERAGNYLRQGDADSLIHDLEDFGRRQPWAVIAGGLFVGFAASRVLKSSSADRYQGRGATAGKPTATTSPVAATTKPASTPVIPATPEPTSDVKVVTPGETPATLLHREREAGLGGDNGIA